MPKNKLFAEFNEFPERPQEHVQETRSRGIFLAAVPERWIPRDISERDYGVDALIEIVPETHYGRGWRVSGDIAAIQFKSTRSPIQWSNVTGIEGLQKATLSGVNTSTVKYWMSLPMPMFVCFADLTSQKMYFASVNEQVRRQFTDLKQQSMSFTVYNVFELTAADGPDKFDAAYHRELHYGNFVHYASDLVLAYGRYKQFLQDHGWRDGFMAVEDPDVVLLGHLWELLDVLAYLCGLTYHLTEITKWFEKDASDWPDSDPSVEPGMLHEATMGLIVKELEPVFDKIAEAVVARLRGPEADYWKELQYPLYQLCGEWEWWKKNESRM